MWQQFDIVLPSHARGMHLVTRDIIKSLPLSRYRIGLLHLFLQHTSAALTLNENADPDVRMDMNEWLMRTVPDGAPYFQHVLEGPDDMTAHIKSSWLGASLSIPVSEGRLALGTWQGIWLCEFRKQGGPRRIVATLQGELYQN